MSRSANTRAPNFAFHIICSSRSSVHTDSILLSQTGRDAVKTSSSQRCVSLSFHVFARSLKYQQCPAVAIDCRIQSCLKIALPQDTAIALMIFGCTLRSGSHSANELELSFPIKDSHPFTSVPKFRSIRPRCRHLRNQRGVVSVPAHNCSQRIEKYCFLVRPWQKLGLGRVASFCLAIVVPRSSAAERALSGRGILQG
jgi:hypothetical protein